MDVNTGVLITEGQGFNRNATFVTDISISFSQLCKVNLKTMIKKYRTELIGISIGTFGGFAYWYFVGCESGTCAITSSPFNSSVYGAIMGALLAGIVMPEKKKEVNEQKK